MNRKDGPPSVARNPNSKQSSFAKATEDTILRSEPPGVGSERRMVEAAGVEPASLPNKPAATTCLVRRESQPPDNVLTRIRLSSPHEKSSARTARTPIPA